MQVEIDNERKAFGSARFVRKNSKSKWWNDEIKAPMESKQVAWKDILGAKEKIVKERCIKFIKGKRGWLKDVYFR